LDRLFNAKPRNLLWLTAVPTALVAHATPASGQVFLSEPQALQAIFGSDVTGSDVTATREVRSLTEAQRKQLEQSSALHFPESSYTFLVVARQNKLVGYGLVVNEIGKSEPITFMVGIGADGKVMDVALMVFRETRGAEVKERRFLRQFHGKRIGDPIQIDRDIINYSGATLSSKALARGVKRALLLLQEFYPPGERHLGEHQGRSLTPTPLSAIAATDGPHPLSLYRQARYRMGTVCEIRVWAASSADALSAFAAGFDEIERLDGVFSNYRDDSELAYVNRTAAETPVELSPDFWQLTCRALHWWKLSRGTFDITVGPLQKAWGFCDGEPRLPSARDLASAREQVGAEKLEIRRRTIRFRRPGIELDFGGLAKGYAADQAARQMRQARASAVLVNLGRSSLCAAGEHLPSAVDQVCVPARTRPSSGLAVGEWPVLISDATTVARESSCLVLRSGWSLATSGSCEKSFRSPDGRVLTHIIDPRTGWPIEGPCSASAISRSGLDAEALTKPLLLLDAFERDTLVRHFGRADWMFLNRVRGGISRVWEPAMWRDLLVPLHPRSV
jgi:FAD:protein FMN transferase